MASSFGRLRELFDHAIELPADQRDAFVAALDGEDAALTARLRELLAAETASTDLEPPPAPQAWQLEPLPTAGAQIGGYRLGAPIAAGGMGIVFEAEQQSPRRKVALKMMRVGFDSPDAARRFRDEAQVLAHLQHPGIARVIDAGIHIDSRIHSERPWFAMEFVENARDLVAFCRDRSIPERLRLFVAVCEAVHHGHQRGVVHRDLKPDNILVGADGVPKVIDFGVARTTNLDVRRTTIARTANEIVGTLRYISPEQLEGSPDGIDTRTDVHALGLILYELLTGELPYALDGKPLTEIARIVRDLPPKRPSAAAQPIRGDLELIVLEAIAKEPAQRYGSAAAFAEDVQRYLRREPIAARPPSLRYQLRMLGRRYRMLAVAAGIAIIATLTAAVVSTVFWLDSEAARELERERADEAETVTRFVEGLLAQGSPVYNRGEQVPLNALLDLAAQELDSAQDARPAVRARLLGTIGTGLSWLGDRDRASALLDEAIALRTEIAGAADELVLRWRLFRGHPSPRGKADTCREVLALVRPDHPPYLIARATSILGSALVDLGSYDEGERLLLRGVELSKAPGVDDVDHVNAVEQFGRYLHRRGHYERARASFERVIAVFQRKYPDGHIRTPIARENIAYCLRDEGHCDDAEAVLADALAEVERIVGDRHPMYARMLGFRASLASRQGRLRRAHRDLTAALAIRRRFASANPGGLARVENDLAIVECELGRESEGRELVDSALARSRALYPDGHLDLANILCSAAGIAWRCGDLRCAETLATEAIRMHAEYAPGDASLLAADRLVLASVAYSEAELEAAEELFSSAIDVLAADSKAVRDTLKARLFLARVHNSRQQPDLALAEVERAFEMIEENGAGGARRGFAHLNRGWALEQNGDHDAARADYRRSLALIRSALPEGHDDLAWPLQHLGRALVEVDPDQAVKLINEAIHIRSGLADTDPLLLGLRLVLGVAQHRGGDYEVAERVLLSVYATTVRGFGETHQFVTAVGNRLADLYDAWGKPASAARYRR